MKGLTVFLKVIHGRSSQAFACWQIFPAWTNTEHGIIPVRDAVAARH
jgi:hypothetical protein